MHLCAVAVWYVVISLIGLSALPVGLYLFKSLGDYAYPFYRIIGFAVISYIVWILGALRILPFGIFSVFVAWAVLILISAFFIYKKKIIITREFVRKVLLYEIFFLIIFAILIAYKLYRSEISDIEKFMDFAFLNAILKADYFPPQDPWFAGHTMEYYYFGHLVTAVLTKITGIQSAITYNLMQATNYALFITAIFSVGYNLTKKYLWAALTVIVAAFMSNISYLIFLCEKTKSYWWDGTRIIPGTINEFPLYSFLLGDLHAHYMDLPFVVLILISFYLFYKKGGDQYPLKIFIGFILGLMFMTNSWDYIIYGFLFAALTIYKNFIKEKHYIQVIKDGLIVGVTSILILLPFYLAFHPASSGMQFVTAPKSLLTDFLILFIPQISVITFYLFYRFIKEKSNYKIPAIVTSVILGGLVFCFSQVTALVLFLLPIWLVVFWNDKKREKGINVKQLVNMLIFMAFCIIVFCEYFYIKDIYGIDWQRANTVFKFYYQLWVIFAVIIGYIFCYFSVTKGKIKYLFFGIAGILLFLSTANLPTMVKESTNNFSYQMGLDGSYYLEKVRPYDYQAVNWINKNVTGQKVIAEMPGESYTDNSRISVFTGNLAPIGWFGHEWGWRDNPNQLDEVKKDIDTLFTTSDEGVAEMIIAKYKIDYIYYGELETENYFSDGSWVIPEIHETVYSNARAAIYKTNR